MRTTYPLLNPVEATPVAAALWRWMRLDHWHPEDPLHAHLASMQPGMQMLYQIGYIGNSTARVRYVESVGLIASFALLAAMIFGYPVSAWIAIAPFLACVFVSRTAGWVLKLSLLLEMNAAAKALLHADIATPGIKTPPA